MTVDSTSIWAYQTLSRLPGAEETGVMTKVYETADRRVDLADRYRAAFSRGPRRRPTNIWVPVGGGFHLSARPGLTQQES